MRLSVIIPCKNEVGVVDTLLASLEVQTKPADEIIVVDSHSSDNTAEHVRKIGKRLPLIVTSASKKGVAEARNHGGYKATSDILLFLDADADIAPDFLENFLYDKQRRSLQAGGFTQRMPSKNLGLRIGARVMNGYARTMSHTPWPIAFSIIFTDSDIFRKLNGFDPEIFIMEDYDYVYRAKKQGFHVGIIGTPFIASDRRYIGPDKPPLWQGIYAELYRYTHGMRITKPLFTYTMGGKKKQ
ncbi:MAG TPA: glycosyltransferase [Candidatus Saccharimonadales bacterium]